MNRYKYKAIDEDGNYIHGKMAAVNPAELASMLHSTNLELISYRVEKTVKLSLFDHIGNRDLVAMFIHLEQLDKAGIPILESISDLKETADSPKIRNLSNEIRESIANGSLLSESLARYPNIFSSVYIGLIASGEKTGHLSQAFNSIIEDLKWTADIKRRTRKAIVGPLFGIFMVFVVMAVMMGVVVPKVTTFLKLQGIALPAATTSLIAFSDFTQNYWMFLILLFPATYLLLKILRRIPEIAEQIDALKLEIPIFGSILTKLDAAKFCQFFAITFKSGIGVMECLDAASLVISNKAMKRSIVVVKQQVSDGHSLARAIASSSYFPSLVVRMFKVGEDSGNMEEALQNVRFFYDREINDSIDRMVAMIQPTLTIVMGGMIMWVTIAVFGPIYGTFSQIR